MTAKKTTIRFHSEESHAKFAELKNGHANIGDFIEDMMQVYEASKLAQTPQTAIIPDNAIVLSEDNKQFFEGSRKREKDLRQSVLENLDLESLEMTESEFLNLASKVSGQTKEEIISKGLQSYGQSLIGKIANGSSRGLGSKDDEISKIVNTLCTMIIAEQLPQFDKLTVTKISQFSGKNYDTVKGWSKRKGVYEMIKDTDNCVTKETMSDFLAKLK